MQRLGLDGSSFSQSFHKNSKRLTSQKASCVEPPEKNVTNALITYFVGFLDSITCYVHGLPRISA